MIGKGRHVCLVLKLLATLVLEWEGLKIMRKKLTLHVGVILVVCVALTAAYFVWQGLRVESAYSWTMDSQICGPAAVVNVCSLHGVRAELSEVFKYAAVSGETTVSLLGCKRALDRYGIRSEAVRFKSIVHLPEGVPILCVMRKQRLPHAVAMIRHGDKTLLVDGQKTEEFSVHPDNA